MCTVPHTNKPRSQMSSKRQLIYLSLYLSTYVPTYLSIYLSIYLFNDINSSYIDVRRVATKKGPPIHCRDRTQNHSASGGLCTCQPRLAPHLQNGTSNAKVCSLQRKKAVLMCITVYQDRREHHTHTHTSIILAALYIPGTA